MFAGCHGTTNEKIKKHEELKLKDDTSLDTNNELCNFFEDEKTNALESKIILNLDGMSNNVSKFVEEHYDKIVKGKKKLISPLKEVVIKDLPEEMPRLD